MPGGNRGYGRLMSRPPDDQRRVERPSGLRTTRHPLFGGAFMAGQFLALNVLGLFSTAYTIRHLGAARYGEWATAAALAAVHLILSTVGLRSIFIRNVAQTPERAAALLAEQLGLRLVLGVVAAVSALAIAMALGYPPIVIACTAVGAVWIMLSVISSTLGDLLQSLERFGTCSMTGLISGLAVTVVAAVAVQQGAGPVGLSLAYLTAPAVSVWLYWRVANRHVRIGVNWDTSRAKALLYESRLLAVGQIAAAARDRIEHLLVPSLTGLEAFGILSAGAMVADRLGNVPDAICTAFYPRMSRAAHGDDGRALQRSVTGLFTIGLAASIPLAMIGTYLASSIADILLPGSRDACRSVIQISVWAVPLLAMSFGMSFSLQAAGQQEAVARLGIRATVISVMISAALVAAFGITGASWSLLTRPAVVASALFPRFRSTFPGVLPGVPFARILLSTATLAALCLMTTGHPIVPALIVVAFGVVTYGLALLASRVFPISAVVDLFDRVLHGAFSNRRLSVEP
jgi:O-antigen/teichoic acid export membrane protein